MGKEFCGKINFKSESYNVYLDDEQFIYVEKESKKNQFSHFNKYKAKTKEEALPLAIEMLKTFMGNAG